MSKFETKIKTWIKHCRKPWPFCKLGRQPSLALGGGPSTACPGPPELELAQESLKISSVRHYSYTKTLRPVAMIRIHQQAQAKLGYSVPISRAGRSIIIKSAWAFCWNQWIETGLHSLVVAIADLEKLSDMYIRHLKSKFPTNPLTPSNYKWAQLITITFLAFTDHETMSAHLFVDKNLRRKCNKFGLDQI